MKKNILFLAIIALFVHTAAPLSMSGPHKKTALAIATPTIAAAALAFFFKDPEVQKSLKDGTFSQLMASKKLARTKILASIGLIAATATGIAAVYTKNESSAQRAVAAAKKNINAIQQTIADAEIHDAETHNAETHNAETQEIEARKEKLKAEEKNLKIAEAIVTRSERIAKILSNKKFSEYPSLTQESILSEIFSEEVMSENNNYTTYDYFAALIRAYCYKQKQSLEAICSDEAKINKLYETIKEQHCQLIAIKKYVAPIAPNRYDIHAMPATLTSTTENSLYEILIQITDAPLTHSNLKDYQLSPENFLKKINNRYNHLNNFLTTERNIDTLSQALRNCFQSDLKYFWIFHFFQEEKNEKFTSFIQSYLGIKKQTPESIDDFNKIKELYDELVYIFDIIVNATQDEQITAVLDTTRPEADDDQLKIVLESHFPHLAADQELCSLIAPIIKDSLETLSRLESR